DLAPRKLYTTVAPGRYRSLYRTAKQWRQVATAPCTVPPQLPQHPTQNLSRRGPRNRVNHFEVANLLVAGHALSDEARQRIEINRSTLSRHEEGLRRLARIRMRHAGAGASSNVGVLEQHGFEFSRRDAEALVLDHFLLALDDVDVSLVVHPADVARVKPAVAQGPGGFFRRVPISPHDLRAAHDDLTDLARTQRALAGLDVNDPVLRIGQQNAAA